MQFYSAKPEWQLILTASITGTTGQLNGWTLDNKLEEAYILHQCLGHIGKECLHTLLMGQLSVGTVVDLKS